MRASKKMKQTECFGEGLVGARRGLDQPAAFARHNGLHSHDSHPDGQRQVNEARDGNNDVRARWEGKHAF